MLKKFTVVLLGFSVLCFVGLGVALWVYINKNQIFVYQLPLQQKWVFNANGQIYTTPVIHRNHIFIGADSQLYCIEATTGELTWSATLPDIVNANPVIQDNKVIVSYRKGAKGFDITTGKELWEQKRQSNYPYSAVVANDRFVVFLSYSAMIHDIETGEFLWRVGEPYPEPLVTAVALDDKTLYAVFENQVQAYDLETGKLLWQDAIKEEGVLSEGLLTEGVFYLKRDQEGLVAYDLKDQKALWQRDDFELSRYPISKQGSVLFLGTRGHIPIALNAQTGTTLWMAEELSNGDDYQTPLIVGDVVYIRGLFMKRIYALDKDTGKSMGYIKLGLPDIISMNADSSLGPVQYEDMIIFPAGKGLFAFGK
jgi:outer membrane protein assembly factor BamB